MKVYLDNAATTAIDKEVLQAMIPVLEKQFGNPSSIHGYGREARSVIEVARKTVANLLKVSPAEIFFTSGGTEANNMAIRCTVRDLGIKHAITTKIEHHAVLHTLEELEKAGDIKLSFVNLRENGDVDLVHLEELLKLNDKTLVSLMHANNEIANVLPINTVGDICVKYDAIFHSDTVQTMGHYPHNLQEIKANFVNCSAHKFHGPKGIGFLYINSNTKIHPLIYGGAQERNMRGGTENIYGIVGLAKALEIAYREMDEHHAHIQGIKSYMIDQLKENIPGVSFNGQSESKNSLYTVLNVSLPPTEMAEMLLFRLDIAGIAASGGSACSSGTNVGSHVLRNIETNPERPAVRFSFSKYNTKEEIDYCVAQLKELYCVKA
jgi:cysteine desulfurase